jgi:hypothetical protein
MFAYSNDASSWTDVESGNTFDTGIVAYTPNLTYDTLLASSVDARYFKIIPTLWESHISVRAGLLILETTEITCNTISWSHET